MRIAKTWEKWTDEREKDYSDRMKTLWEERRDTSRRLN